MGLDRINPALQWKVLWLVLGWSLVLLIVYLSLKAPTPPSPSFFNLPNLDKVGHCLAYFTLTGWFVQLYVAPRTRLKFALGFIALGIILEILQGLGGMRQADWKDAVANMTGVLLAWQLGKTWFATRLETFENWCRHHAD
ncbi:MAG: hypothetical protein RL368_699 [Pseudomonadota bacterium]|jgi:VanZ family protein